MSEISWEQIERLLDKALDLPEQERQAFLDKECENDNALKNEILELLHSISTSEGWLENAQTYKQDIYQNLSEGLNTLSLNDALVGSKIGAYTIKERIGEGGMGLVYLAERTGDFSRQVAIKIIRQGRATEENIRRFKREQRILAKLNHPGIAQLYDGGITRDGFPYIIMEYVEGIAITKYCKIHNCTISQKTGLFKQALEAVRNAHENLTIHRDLKPDNILIDTSGRVKILDFGISKLLEDEEDSMITKTGSRLLTPRYAAPEQIKQESITTATDLYSLGIVFYMLLTEAEPIAFGDLTQYEIEQAIIYKEPAKPSDNVKNARVKRQLKGDLDAIILKSIRKEPEARYRVANEFLKDLDNYKYGLPVSARDGSFRYRSHKFIQRHKQGLVIATVFVGLLIALTIFHTIRITKEKDIAQTETQRALVVKNLLLDIFKANDPISSKGSSVTLTDLLEVGTQKIVTNNIEPDVRIELLLVLSNIYQNITQYDEARKLADKSLDISLKYFGKQSINEAKSLMRIGSIEHEMGNFVTGKNYFKKASTIINGKLPESNALFGELYDNLGFSEEKLGNYDSSRYYFQRSLENIQSQPKPDSNNYISELRNVARAQYRNKNPQKGDSLLLLALNVSKRVNGEQDVITASVLNDLGLYSMTQARYEEARSYYSRSLAIKDSVYGAKGHPNYSATLTNLGVLEETFGNLKQADSLYQKALEMDTQIFGEHHPNIAISKGHLATIYFKMKEYEKSKKLREEALALYLEIYGPNHNYVGTMYQNYAQLLSEMGDLNNAAIYFKKAGDIILNDRSSSTRDFARFNMLSALNLYRMKDFQNASERYAKASTYYDQLSHPYFKITSAQCEIKFGECLLELGKKDKANAVFSKLKAKIDSSDVLKNDSGLQALFKKATNH